MAKETNADRAKRIAKAIYEQKDHTLSAADKSWAVKNAHNVDPHLEKYSAGEYGQKGTVIDNATGKVVDQGKPNWIDPSKQVVPVSKPVQMSQSTAVIPAGEASGGYTGGNRGFRADNYVGSGSASGATVEPDEMLKARAEKMAAEAKAAKPWSELTVGEAAERAGGAVKTKATAALESAAPVVKKGLGYAGKAAPWLAAGMEGLDVLKVAQDPLAEKKDVVQQALVGAGKLGLSAAGAAKLAAMAPAHPLAKGVAGLAGGVLGYMAPGMIGIHGPVEQANKNALADQSVAMNEALAKKAMAEKAAKTAEAAKAQPQQEQVQSAAGHPMMEVFNRALAAMAPPQRVMPNIAPTDPNTDLFGFQNLRNWQNAAGQIGANRMALNDWKQNSQNASNIAQLASGVYGHDMTAASARAQLRHTMMKDASEQALKLAEATGVGRDDKGNPIKDPVAQAAIIRQMTQNGTMGTLDPSQRAARAADAVTQGQMMTAINANSGASRQINERPQFRPGVDTTSFRDLLPQGAGWSGLLPGNSNQVLTVANPADPTGASDQRVSINKFSDATARAAALADAQGNPLPVKRPLQGAY